MRKETVVAATRCLGRENVRVKAGSGNINYLSPQCDQKPEIKQLKGKDIYLGSQFVCTQSVMMEKAG